MIGQGGQGRWRSLRLRILLAIVAWTALGIAGIWYSGTRLFAKHVEQQYHEELEVHVRELGELTELDSSGRPYLVRPLSDPRYAVPLSGFYWQVTRPGFGTVSSPSMIRGSLDHDIAHSSHILHRVENGPTGKTIVYGFVRRVPPGPSIHFVIATDERHLQRAVQAFTGELAIWLALLAAALMLTGLAVVSFGLRPLNRLAQATAMLRSGRAARLEGAYPTEIAPLVDDLNAYIEHNRGIVERARVAAGNLAHALRTPLAVMTDEAERLAQSPRTKDAGEVLLAQAEAMIRQIEYQLARARSAAGARGPATVSRIGEVLPPILSAMRRLHPDRRFEADDGDAAGLALAIDPVDLSELLSILIDNAGKWGRARVRVDLAPVEGALRVSVIDDGPGLTPAQTQAAFGIGTRFDADTPGYGLGLAIARDIAEAYGIHLDLEARRDGLSGLAAVIAVPLVAEPARRLA